MDQAEANGKTVEDALNKALQKLGASRDEVEFVVLDEGRKGGLFGRGAKDAVVRVDRLPGGARQPQSIDRSAVDTSIPRSRGGRGGRSGSGQRSSGGSSTGSGQRSQRRSLEEPSPKLTEEAFRLPSSTGSSAPAPRGGRSPKPATADERPPRQERPRGDRRRREEEPYVEPNIDAAEVDLACQTVDDLLRILDIPADITIRPPETPGDGLGMALAVVEIHGDDLGLLIGRRGETLNSLQYVTNLVVNRKHPEVHSAVTIDVEQYRKRREMQLIDMAERMGDRVRRTGSPITLEPMTPAERRIIHLTLAEDPELSTESIGEGEARKVVISSRN